ncbi:MAG: thioether cross-link-forming SCIFF peptide maturase [Clostridiales bacterium]|nr:thioether cross-link-forming SCIFF peptide maturase [Clostridiales bacterium]
MIHRFSMKGVNILMDINSGSVHVVDDAAYALSAVVAPGMTEECPEDILRSLSDQFTGEQLREAYRELYELEQNGYLFADDDYINIAAAIPAGAPIKALCLHVSHDCNLRCKYCFAETGDFGMGKRMTMDFDVAKKAIDFVIEKSGARRNIEIDFFGGEPLMAWDTVTRTVDYARSLEKEKKKKFRFTITTNGLLLDDEKIDYINKNMDNCVLSLDGRKCVNDEMRPTAGGVGSYDVIVPKFKKLVSQRGKDRDYYVRGTFTSKNLDFTRDVLAIADEGFDQLSVEPVTSEPGTGYDISEKDLPRIGEEYEKLVDVMQERRKAGKGFNFFHFMVDLQQGPCVIKRLRGCGAGYEYVAVTPDGEIYPCHQFVGHPEFLLGTLDDGKFDMDISNHFSRLNVCTRPKCQDCWAKFYCSGGCAAANFNMNGDIETPYEMGCELQKKRLECAIYLKAAEMLED